MTQQPASLTLEQILTPTATCELSWLLLRLPPGQDVQAGLQEWLGTVIHQSFVEAVLGSVGIHEIHDATGSRQVLEEAGRWDDGIEGLYEPRPVPTDERPVAPAKSQDQPRPVLEAPASVPARRSVPAVSPSVQPSVPAWEIARQKEEEDAALSAAAEESEIHGASFFEDAEPEPEEDVEEPTPKRPVYNSPAEQAVANRVAVQAVLDEHDILPGHSYQVSRIAKWCWTEQGHQISGADVGTVLRSLGWQLRSGAGPTAYFAPSAKHQ